MTRIRTSVAVGAVIAVVAGAVLVWRWWHDHPPYAASVLHASAEVHAVTDDEAQAFLRPANVPRIGADGQLIAGRVTWSRPPARKGSFSLYLIDKRTRLKPPVIEVGGAQVSVGGNGWDTAVSARYPWLRGAGDVYKDGVWWGTGWDMTVAVASGVTSVAFVAVFPNEDPGSRSRGTYATAPVDVADLLVGLVFVGDDRQIYWAQRLLG